MKGQVVSQARRQVRQRERPRRFVQTKPIPTAVPIWRSAFPGTAVQTKPIAESGRLEVASGKRTECKAKSFGASRFTLQTPNVPNEANRWSVVSCAKQTQFAPGRPPFFGFFRFFRLSPIQTSRRNALRRHYEHGCAVPNEANWPRREYKATAFLDPCPFDFAQGGACAGVTTAARVAAPNEANFQGNPG